MGFYEQTAAILRPVEMPRYYGGGDTAELSYEAADGAVPEAIPFGVDIQPRMEIVSADGGERLQVQTGWTLHTPAGVDLDVDELARVIYRGDECPVIRVDRWESTDYPSGVDHVEVEFEYKKG